MEAAGPLSALKCPWEWLRGRLRSSCPLARGSGWHGSWGGLRMAAAPFQATATRWPSPLVSRLRDPPSPQYFAATPQAPPPGADGQGCLSCCICPSLSPKRR